MTYTEIDTNQFVPGGDIRISSFGQVVHDDFEDHETRLETVETAVSNQAGQLNIITATGGRRWHSSTAQLIGSSQAAGVPVIHPFDSVESASETGYTYISSGVNTGAFQIASTGMYAFFANTCGMTSTDTGYYVQSFISKVNSANGTPTGFRFGYDGVGVGTQNQRIFMRAGAMNVSVNAGDYIALFVCLDVASSSTKTYAPSAPATPSGLTPTTTHVSNFAIKRVG